MSVLLSLLAQAAVPPMVQAPAEDVVVIARRLNGWRGTITTNLFGTRCTTERSTGDRALDAIGCKAMRHCWPDTLARFRASRAERIGAAAGERLRLAAKQDFDACLRPRRLALIKDYRAGRRGGGDGGER